MDQSGGYRRKGPAKPKPKPKAKSKRQIGQSTSPWVVFLKQYSKKHGIKYGDAMRSPEARTEYREKWLLHA